MLFLKENVPHYQANKQGIAGQTLTQKGQNHKTRAAGRFIINREEEEEEKNSNPLTNFAHFTPAPLYPWLRH